MNETVPVEGFKGSHVESGDKTYPVKTTLAIPAAWWCYQLNMHAYAYAYAYACMLCIIRCPNNAEEM